MVIIISTTTATQLELKWCNRARMQPPLRYHLSFMLLESGGYGTITVNETAVSGSGQSSKLSQVYRSGEFHGET